MSQCKEDEPKQLDAQTIYMIDTLMARHYRTMDAELDSICIIKQDSLVALAIDSIKEQRLKEIEAIIKSGLNEPQ